MIIQAKLEEHDSGSKERTRCVYQKIRSSMGVEAATDEIPFARVEA